MDRGAWRATVHGLQRVGHNSIHIVTHINVNKSLSNIWQKKKVIEICMQYEFI